MVFPSTSLDASVIVNADDFGYSEQVNNAILKSFENSLITSTTLLVNMPGFEDAVEKIGTNCFFKNKVGLHLNLVEGFPLSEPIKKQKRLCDDCGKFCYKRNSLVFSLNVDEKRAIELEVEAQIKKLLERGISISHADSHHGTHTEWGIGKIILKVLADHKIDKVRIARNMGYNRGPLKEIYKTAFNSYLRLRKFRSVDLFGDIEDFIYSSSKRKFDKKTLEIMVHPIRAENSIITDLDYGDMSHKLKPLLEKFRVIGYAEI